MANKKNLYYGNIEVNDYHYKWNAEPGACEKCQALDGKTFEDANEISDKPHPNCKCSIEVVRNRLTDSIDNETEIRELELEFEKLKGDLARLEDECNFIFENLKLEEKYISEYKELIINNLVDKNLYNNEIINCQIALKNLRAAIKKKSRSQK